MTVKDGIQVLAWLAAGALLFLGLHAPLGGVLKAGPLLDPWNGIYLTARQAHHPQHSEVRLEGLTGPVTVERDARGVPHIFAANDQDALIALGYVVAQDRLFQMDFLERVASGRLAEVFGPASVSGDRYLRQTGMEWAAQRIAHKIHSDAGLELDVIDAFALGANAYIGSLDESELPFEFRLFGHRPGSYSALSAARLIQYFNFDLSYSSEDLAYGTLLKRLGQEAFEELYPAHSPLYVPIVPAESPAPSPVSLEADHLPYPHPPVVAELASSDPLTEGFRPGKGSNNWAVHRARSATGRPLLAGDMHLSLSLPSIWYEAHIVTPDMNLYGVLAPGTALLVEAFSDSLGWVFTNMSADAMDYYALDLDEERRRYRFDGSWSALTPVADTIYVEGAAPVVDTLWYTHMGPLLRTEGNMPVAMRWAAFEDNATLTAMWGLSKAGHVDQADSALRHWGAPALNVLLADHTGSIALRSSGHVPVLADGGSRVGIQDGTSSQTAWVGRLPHLDMPYAKDPAQGFLSSSNQRPTGADYPYYLGHNWPSSYRSMRLHALLSQKTSHDLRDMMLYQRDVHVVQHDLLTPHLEALRSLSAKAQTLRDTLLTWDGKATTDRSEPLVLYTLLEVLETLAWDEPAFNNLPQPRSSTLMMLLSQGSRWLDVVSTPTIEDAPALLALALEATADTLVARYGDREGAWRWGTHHKLFIRHLTQTPALSALWSDAYEYPGFDETVAPGGGLTVTHSASWRMIVDFSDSPPRGYGVYPGGQSGNPFSSLYDLHMDTYVDFGYYELAKPKTAGLVPDASVLTLLPQATSER